MSDVRTISLMDLEPTVWSDTEHTRADGSCFITVSRPGAVVDFLESLFALPFLTESALQVDGDELRLRVANADLTFQCVGTSPDKGLRRYAFLRGSWEPEEVAVQREGGCTWCEQINHLHQRHVTLMEPA